MELFGNELDDMGAAVAAIAILASVAWVFNDMWAGIPIWARIAFPILAGPLAYVVAEKVWNRG